MYEPYSKLLPIIVFIYVDFGFLSLKIIKLIIKEENVHKPSWTEKERVRFAAFPFSSSNWFYMNGEAETAEWYYTGQTLHFHTQKLYDLYISHPTAYPDLILSLEIAEPHIKSYLNMKNLDDWPHSNNIRNIDQNNWNSHWVVRGNERYFYVSANSQWEI